MFNENAFENGGYQSMSGIQTSPEEMDERYISTGSGSGALLELLAEVASQKLRSDPSVKCTNTAEPRISPRNIIQKGKSYIKKKRTSHRGRSHGVVDVEYVKALTANQLIKTFSEFDGDEMKRMFTYKCTFDPQHCNKHFASFGSEGKARQQLKIHLLEHVKKLEKNECEKYFSSNVRDTEYTQVAAKLKAETFKRTFHKEDICDENDSSLSNKEPGRCIENNAINTYVLSPNSLRENNVIKREKATSCCTADAPQRTELAEKSSYASNHDNEKELIHDKIYNEHNYTTFGAKFCSASSDIHNSVKNEGMKLEDSDENCAQQGDTSLDNMQSKCLGKLAESDVCDMVTVSLTGKNQFNSSQLPCVGQEVDVSTCVSLKNTEPGCHFILHNKSEKFEAKTATFREVNKNVERDEYRLKKKPKGKAKFIGQSKAEKEMAIQMIDSMKRKENVVESLECHICNPPRTFTAPTTLISHYRSHAGIKPYECRLCRSVFTRQHSLNYHMLIHTNQTRFTCGDCGRKFRHPSHFKEHRRRHTGESPYECSDCMLRFKTRNTYKRHLKTRHGKVLTTSGGLIVLSEEEFKSVRTSPRSVDSNNKGTARKNLLKGKVLTKFSSKKKNVEQGVEDRKENKCITHSCTEENVSPRHCEVGDNSDMGKYRNCEMDYLENSSDSNDDDERQHSKYFPFDVVEVAMRQSNISFMEDKSDNSNDADAISEKEFDSQKSRDCIKSDSYLEESVSTLNVTVKETYESDDKKDEQFQKDVSNVEKATFLAGNSKCIAQLLPQPPAEPLLVTNSVALSPVFIETLFPDEQTVSSKLKDNHSSSSVLTVIRRQHCDNSSQWRNRSESKHLAHESNEGRTVVVVANTS
ncbi:zinc finger protein 107-like isoform X1 [Schistocerca cancellata]|uniref:zinc finger protein 107-like isoform X1 n=2 Tax=Schistocerca cancellata TaxID=274614 RepID=UPI002118B0EF|nr:zinc finger protein 107-like isoform X1 [Schistocerca cancellata]